MKTGTHMNLKFKKNLLTHTHTHLQKVNFTSFEKQIQPKFSQK